DAEPQPRRAGGGGESGAESRRTVGVLDALGEDWPEGGVSSGMRSRSAGVVDGERVQEVDGVGELIEAAAAEITVLKGSFDQAEVGAGEVTARQEREPVADPAAGGGVVHGCLLEAGVGTA